MRRAPERTTGAAVLRRLARSLLAVVLASSLAVAGCGDDNKDEPKVPPPGQDAS